MGEVAVRLWLAFQTSSQHKITSWEDNLWACDNLFRLTFLQSVKATERYRGSARDQWLLVTSAKQHPASGFSNHTERGRHCFISFILRYSAPHSIASALCNFQLTACFVTHNSLLFRQGLYPAADVDMDSCGHRGRVVIPVTHFSNPGRGRMWSWCIVVWCLKDQKWIKASKQIPRTALHMTTDGKSHTWT